MYPHLIINPFIIYSLSWLLVLLIYNLNWSYLLPQLSFELKAFLWLSILLSFITGVLFHYKKVFSYKVISKTPNLPKIKKILFLIWSLLIIEFIFAGGIPILGYITGERNISYTDFGLPIIHVLVINSFELLFIYLCYCYYSTTDKVIKKKIALYIFLSVLPYILIFNRMGLMTCFLAYMLLFILSKKSLWKILIKITLSSTICIYLFGIAGDLRLDTATAKNIILELGEATPEFKNSSIPKELFWGYLYISSPLANCQYTINQKKNFNFESNSILGFCLFELTPEIISKRLAETYSIKREEAILINSTFNVSSVYAQSYNYLGWYGMIFMYFFMYIFIFISMLLIPKESPYHLCGIIVIDIIIIFNIFSNMFVFMGVVPQVLFTIILSINFFIRRIRQKYITQSLQTYKLQ